MGLREPVFIDDARFFKVIIYKVAESAGKRQGVVVEYARKTGYVRRKDIGRILNVKERRAREILRRLVEEGFLQLVGRGRNRVYKLASL